MKKPSAALMGIGGAVINWCPFFCSLVQGCLTADNTSREQPIAALSFSKRGGYTQASGEFSQRPKKGGTAQRGRGEKAASTEDPKGGVEDNDNK